MKYLKFLHPWIELTSAIVLLTGCVDVDLSLEGDSDTINEIVGRNKGYYIDEPVVNVDYKCGMYQGRTDSKGAFFFQNGEGCTFSIGSLKLREVKASSLKEEVHLIESDVNVASLLQSLDKNGMVDGTIDIDENIIEFFNNENIKVVPKTYMERKRLIETINRELRPEIPYITRTDEEALNHIIEVIEKAPKDKITLTIRFNNGTVSGNGSSQTTVVIKTTVGEKKDVKIDSTREFGDGDEGNDSTSNTSDTSSNSSDTSKPILKLAGDKLIYLNYWR